MMIEVNVQGAREGFEPKFTKLLIDVDMIATIKEIEFKTPRLKVVEEGGAKFTTDIPGGGVPSGIKGSLITFKDQGFLTVSESYEWLSSVLQPIKQTSTKRDFSNN